MFMRMYLVQLRIALVGYSQHCDICHIYNSQRVAKLCVNQSLGMLLYFELMSGVV
jgi:hypothetical protein